MTMARPISTMMIPVRIPSSAIVMPIASANGRYYGSGMWIASDAGASDGSCSSSCAIS
jgi:hypothetical protein